MPESFVSNTPSAQTVDFDAYARVQKKLLEKKTELKQMEQKIISLNEKNRYLEIAARRTIDENKHSTYEINRLKTLVTTQENTFIKHHNTQNGILFPWLTPKSLKISRNVQGFFYILALYGVRTALSCKFTSREHMIPFIENLDHYYAQNHIQLSKWRKRMNAVFYFYATNGFFLTVKQIFKTILK